MIHVNNQLGKFILAEVLLVLFDDVAGSRRRPEKGVHQNR